MASICGYTFTVFASPELPTSRSLGATGGITLAIIGTTLLAGSIQRELPAILGIPLLLTAIASALAGTTPANIAPLSNPIFVALTACAGAHVHGRIRWNEFRMRSLATLRERQIASYAEQLRLSNTQLEQFARIASHDLQQPLCSISWSLRSILNDCAKDGTSLKDISQRLERLTGVTNRMQELIRRLLGYAQLDNVELDQAPVDLDLVIRETKDALRAAIEESGAEIHTSEMPVIQGDRCLLQRLFQNILDNAIKYRKPGIPPRIRVEATRDGDLHKIRIFDDGTGIPVADLENVFTPSYRSAPSDDVWGTGLGLGTCRKIVHRHGGSIVMENRPDAATTVCLTLPEEPETHRLR